MNTVELIKEFSSRYDKHYEFDCDSDMGIVYFSYSIDHCCALERLHLEFDEDIFSIYRDFLYEDCDSAFRVIETIKEEKVFIESLRRIIGHEPEVQYDDGLGCPFVSNQIGFFGIPFSWNELNKTIEILVNAFRMTEKLSFYEIDIGNEEQLEIEEYRKQIMGKLKNASPFLCNKYLKDHPLGRACNCNSENVYISRFDIALTGVGLNNLQLLSHPLNKVCSFYSGFKYFITKVDDNRIIYDLKIVREVINAFSQVDEECDMEPMIKYSVDTKARLIISCGELWVAICRVEPEDSDRCFTYEKNRLKKMEKDFLAVAPHHFWGRSFDFTGLNEQQFESFCRDLLLSLGFINVQIRGNIRAADGGVDITADEEYCTLISSERRKWIFQCKHMKQQVSRKDISEARDLLKEFHADCYGLFYSGFFSPNTIDRIRTISAEGEIIIKGWDYNDLEVELSKKPSLAAKYFGL